VLGKWVIAAFLGFAAIFATDLRANPSEAAEKDFQSMLEWPELSDVMKTHLVSIHDKLGVTVQLNRLMLKGDDRAQVDRALGEVDSPRFNKAFEGIATSCGMRADKITLGAVFIWTGTNLVLDSFDRGLLANAERVPRECAAIEPSRATLAAALAPRNFVLQKEDIFNGKLKSDGASRWSRAAIDYGLAKAIDAFETSCWQKIERVELGSYTHYNQSAKIIELNSGESPRAVILRLGAAASACVKTLPKLSELNQRYAVDRGLVLSLDPWEFYKGTFTSAQVARILDSYLARPERLDALKDKILAKAAASDYPQVRARAARHAIPIELGTMDGYPKSGFAEGILAVLTGGFILLPVIAAIDVELEGRTYFLNVTRAL
jgi:hypothetical protein